MSTMARQGGEEEEKEIIISLLDRDVLWEEAAGDSASPERATWPSDMGLRDQHPHGGKYMVFAFMFFYLLFRLCL